MNVKRQKILEGRNPLLELCPFCGEPAEIFCETNHDGCKVRCSNQDCQFRPESKQFFPSEEHAIKAWNAQRLGNEKIDMSDFFY